MLGVTQEVAENEIIHAASELAQKESQQHKTIVFLMRGEAASLIGRGYSHRCTGGATAIFIRRPFPAFEKNNRRNRIFSGNTT